MKKICLFIFFVIQAVVSWKGLHYFPATENLEANLFFGFGLIVGFFGAGTVCFSALYDSKGNGHYPPLLTTISDPPTSHNFMRANYIIFRVGILFIAVLCSISVVAQSNSTDSIGESEESMQIAEIRASFPGGQRELMSWLAQNLHYPKEMKEIQGRVLVSFYVEKDGSISDVNVERPCIKEDGTSSTVIVEHSEMSALDKEVIRVVKTMPQWIPAMHHGKPVREKHFMPLNIDPQ